MGLFKSDPPPAPNMQPMADALMQSAKMNDARSQEQFDFFKTQYAQDREVANRMLSKQEEVADFNLSNAKEDRQRYEDTFRPMEDQFVGEANSYDSEERRRAAAGQAQADVAQQFKGARDNATRNLESYGINPAATRYAALDLSARTQEAATKAAAGNVAQRDVENTGRNMRMAAINIGRGLPAQAAGEFNTTLQGAGAGVNTQLATTASGANTTGTAPQYSGLAMQGNTGAASVLNQSYQNQLAQWKADNADSSGIGALAGVALGAAMAPTMPGASPAYKTWFAKEGGAIPIDASPSHGEMDDDVPANLDAGEYVIPADIVKRLGTKHFDKLIEKERGGDGKNAKRRSAIPGYAHGGQVTSGGY